MSSETMIRVVLADDNVIVREGVRALLSIAGDVEVVGVAGDYDELLAGAAEHVPQVVVTDIRMPPDFTDEGIRAARMVRKSNPGTGVVILSQYDEPEYAISLLSEGAAGYAYLLKDRVGDGDQLARAVREVSTGGSMIDPRIVDALTKPVSDAGGLTDIEERLLRMVAEGKPIKAIAASLHTTPASVADDVEQLFLKLAQQARTGTTAHAPQGDRRPRGAGRELEPHVAGWCCAADARARRRGWEDRATHCDGADVRYPVVLHDCGGFGPVSACRPAQRAPIGDEPCGDRRGWHGDAVRRRCGDGGVRCTAPTSRSCPACLRGRDCNARRAVRGERALEG